MLNYSKRFYFYCWLLLLAGFDGLITSPMKSSYGRRTLNLSTISSNAFRLFWRSKMSFHKIE